MPRSASYECYSDFVIRTPVFSLDAICEIPRPLNLSSDFLIQQWENPVVKDAILLASPVLFRQIEAEISKGQISQRISRAFFRYFLRMCYRCTPFGLFAAVGTGVITDKTSIALDDLMNYKVNYRLDMEYLGAKAHKLASDLNFRPKLKYLANSSLYRNGLKWRYVEAYFNKDGRKKYRIVSVDCQEAVNIVISNASSFRNWDYLFDLIVNMGYSFEESIAFLHELIDAQILVPEIMPSLTGQEFSVRLFSQMNDLESTGDWIKNLRILHDSISDIIKPGFLSNKYEEIVQLAGKGEDGFTEAHLIQGDLYSAFNISCLSKEVSNKVLLGIRILKVLSRSRPNTTLDSFKKQFTDRYGNREIPLHLVMDTENGIGIGSPDGQQMNDPSPLLDGLDFPIDTTQRIYKSPHPFLRSRIESVKSKTSNYIELSKVDLRELDLRKGEWPSQLFALCYIAGSEGDVKVVLDMASSGNSAHINGRFGFNNPNDTLNKHINTMLEFDKNNSSGCLFAEVAHLPEDRTGNILQRPSYYDWEIPYLVNPGGIAGLIKPSEILVSVEKNRVILRRSKDRKRIIPRMTTAHNYKGRQLPVYQLLAECAFQDSMGGFFPEWGYLYEDRSFLPGIRFGQLIVSMPRWRLVLDEDLKTRELNSQDLYNKILAWVDKNKLPNRVVWIELDREIFIDWSSITIVLSVWDLIRRKTVVEFQEDPFESGSPVSGPGGSYANQVLFSFYKS